jgi:hypothetical protein
MASADQEGALARAARLRFPDLRELHGRARIEALVDHITEAAIIRGELEELRLEAQVQARDTRRHLDRVPATVLRSRAAAVEARRLADPGAAQQLDDAQWVIDRCTEQIHRLGGSEYDVASRAYTMLTG